MISSQDKDVARDVTEALHGAFVTGSYLTNKDDANDIDIVVSEAAWLLWVNGHAPLYCGDVMVMSRTFKQQEMEGTRGNYGDVENEMFELVSHWRCDGVNILVIRDIFLVAYKAASYYLESFPAKYQDRESRVEVHQRCKQQIREMLATAAEGDELPW